MLKFYSSVGYSLCTERIISSGGFRSGRLSVAKTWLAPLDIAPAPMRFADFDMQLTQVPHRIIFDPLVRTVKIQL